MRTGHTSSTTQLKLKRTCPKLDVRAVVAVEGRLHPDGVAARAEELEEDAPPVLLLAFARGVERLAKVAGALAGDDELRIERVVQLTRQHLLTLATHKVSSRHLVGAHDRHHDAQGERRRQ
jgi:hypothetical protein